MNFPLIILKVKFHRPCFPFGTKWLGEGGSVCRLLVPLAKQRNLHTLLRKGERMHASKTGGVVKKILIPKEKPTEQIPSPSPCPRPRSLLLPSLPEGNRPITNTHARLDHPNRGEFDKLISIANFLNFL